MLIWRSGASVTEPRSNPGDDFAPQQTEMAKYIEPSQSFLSMTKRSMYIDKDNPEHVKIAPHHSRQIAVSLCLSICENSRVVFPGRRTTPGNDGRAHPHRHEVSLSKTAHHLPLASTIRSLSSRLKLTTRLTFSTWSRASRNESQLLHTARHADVHLPPAHGQRKRLEALG